MVPDLDPKDIRRHQGIKTKRFNPFTLRVPIRKQHRYPMGSKRSKCVKHEHKTVGCFTLLRKSTTTVQHKYIRKHTTTQHKDIRLDPKDPKESNIKTKRLNYYLVPGIYYDGYCIIIP